MVLSEIEWWSKYRNWLANSGEYLDGKIALLGILQKVEVSNLNSIDISVCWFMFSYLVKDNYGKYFLNW